MASKDACTEARFALIAEQGRMQKHIDNYAAKIHGVAPPLAPIPTAICVPVNPN
jgi:hypothetical protein